MKLPLSPPDLRKVIDGDPGAAVRALEAVRGLDVDGRYEHWDHLRHLAPPPGLTVEQWWLGLRLARRGAARRLPLDDKQGRRLALALTDSMWRRLHFLDREAAGSIRGLDPDDDVQSRDLYLARSLIEEAMTSSQLEGASTTREVAKEMLRSGRAPRDRSEQMIYNNYAVMRRLAQWRDQPMTSTRLLEIHRLLCTDTIEDAGAAGRWRRSDEAITVVDHRDGTTLHDPPPAAELTRRVDALCAFANQGVGAEFLHPVVHAIALHYQLAYDHPFVDGNGRTARALFYWAMLRSGYWLTEFLSISSVIKKAPMQYARAFLLTQTDESDLGYFVDHQLDVIERAVEALRLYVERKDRERRQAEMLLAPRSRLGARLNHRQRALLLDALRHRGRVYRIAQHQQAHGVTYQTARTDLLGLVGAKLLVQRKVGKAFVFSAVPDLERRVGARRSSVRG